MSWFLDAKLWNDVQATFTDPWISCFDGMCTLQRVACVWSDWGLMMHYLPSVKPVSTLCSGIRTFHLAFELILLRRSGCWKCRTSNDRQETELTTCHMVTWAQPAMPQAWCVRVQNTIGFYPFDRWWKQNPIGVYHLVIIIKTWVWINFKTNEIHNVQNADHRLDRPGSGWAKICPAKNWQVKSCEKKLSKFWQVKYDKLSNFSSQSK